MHATDPVLCGGYLKKVTASRLKGDYDRYFELRGAQLLYFKSPPVGGGEKPLGVIDLRETAIVEDPKKRLAWTITGPNMHKPYTLHAGNEAEKKLWVDKLRKVIAASSPIPLSERTSSKASLRAGSPDMRPGSLSPPRLLSRVKSLPSLPPLLRKVASPKSGPAPSPKASPAPSPKASPQAMPSASPRLKPLPGAAGVAGSRHSLKKNVFDEPKQIGVDDFEPLCVVGKGSFGKVMQVRKRDTKEVFAMKCMSKELILREGLVEHMKAEKNILASINHPFIVKLHYAFQTRESLFLILDFLSGGELFYHLSQVGTFPESRARFYTAQIGLALGHLHSLDIIYRDLKPENCVLDKKGNCCITDFGLAKPGISGREEATTFCGTPEYLAPEFLTGGGHGRAVDWWSLGILLYEMVTGLPPFYSENLNEMYEFIMHKALTFPSNMGAAARDLCTRLLDRKPELRLQQVEEFRAHAFFNGFDMDGLLAGRLQTPFEPDAKGLNFEAEFTDLPARHSVAQVAAGQVVEGQFDGFHFDRRAHRKKVR